jgi:hypothetical protein
MHRHALGRDHLLNSLQGQLVWLKYAFDALARQKASDVWTVQQLDLLLLEGLYGTYRWLLGSIRRALLNGSAEDKALWPALHFRVLPVLLVTQEAVTLPTLAWLAGVSHAQVQQGLDLLSSLFPCKPHGGGVTSEPRVLPYHKSVLDWLGSEQHAGQDLAVSHEQGHALAAAACAGVALSLPQSNTLDSPADTLPCTAGQWQGQVLDTGVLGYTRRHTVLHSSAAKGSPGLDQVVMSPAFWQHVFAQGRSGPGMYVASMAEVSIVYESSRLARHV